MNKKEKREVLLADMHSDGIRFSEALKIQKKQREERMKEIDKKLKINKNK